MVKLAFVLFFWFFYRCLCMRCSITEMVKLLQEALTCLTGTVFEIKTDLPNSDCVNGDTAWQGTVKMKVYLVKWVLKCLIH